MSTIAFAQTYFAVQTRRMELTDLEYEKMDEDEKNYIEESKQVTETIH